MNLHLGVEPHPPQEINTRGGAPYGGGLAALCLIAGQLGVAANPQSLIHQLALDKSVFGSGDLVRAAKSLGLKARAIRQPSLERLQSIPKPAIISLTGGGWAVLGREVAPGRFVLVDPVSPKASVQDLKEIFKELGSEIILVTRRAVAADSDGRFGVKWFTSAIWRYKSAIIHVLVASLFIQIFSLVSPLIFQMVVDKVLIYKSKSTLVVLVVAMVGLAVFDGIMKYLRAYALTHTSNRVDIELGSELCAHLFNLPIKYFEQRPAGVTVARVREIETVRNFLTGQALFSLIDALFIFVFIGVLLIYSLKLTLIVVISIPVYVGIAAILRPIMRDRIKQKFNYWSYSQQFVVESIVGAQTLKAAAAEPLVQRQWTDRLAAYVGSGFKASMSGTVGQTIIEFVTKLVAALILYFGAQEVIEGSLTVGELIAFNMISNQIIQPILRISQLWQDFQQVLVSIERLGDIMNAPKEPKPENASALPPATGAIEFRGITFSYRPELPDAVKNIRLEIAPGETIGIVGASGSGKSTLTKLLQRFYTPRSGQIFVDGMDIAQIDPAWLRKQLGVVLQENLLFNRTIHENIALARPDMPRGQVRQVARLAGAEEFIAKLPLGYDTPIEERGANLSGGQRQRIAIARALATNPRILVLDEATSALDYDSERIIQMNMREIVRGRTVIIIAHRLAAVRDCDRIVGMAQGEIVEIGTHLELRNKEGGLYAHLWALQSEQATG